jgi:MFS family permease
MTNPRRSLFSVLGSLRTSGQGRIPLSSVTKRIFALSFTFEFIVIYPFYVIMLGQRGVSAAGVGLLLATLMIVSVASEVPTGIIADKISKKWSLVLGRVMQLLTFGIWLMAPNFTGYLIGFIFWGIGEAFTSGAFQAYLYESLDDRNKQAFGKIYSRSSAVTMLAYASAGVVAFLVGPHYNLLLVLSMAVSAVSLGITLSLPSTKPQVEVEIRPKILATAVGAIRRRPELRHILLLAVIIQGLMGVIAEYLPAYYYQVGLPARSVALVISVGSITAALLYWWMHRVERQLAKYRIVIMVAATGLFALTFWGGPLVAVFGMFMFSRVLRVVTVANESLIQHHAPDEARATVGSLYSFVGKLLSAGLIALIGALAIGDKMVVPLRWSSVVMVGIFVLVALFFAARRKRQPAS